LPDISPGAAAGDQPLGPSRSEAGDLPPFHWTGFDVTLALPANWQEQIRHVALRHAHVKQFPPTPLLTREAPDVTGIHRGRVRADVVKRELRWLYDLYRSKFTELARIAAGEPVAPAADDRYGVVLNLQAGTSMRFECHIDSNPLTGLLFCTDHAPGAGGEIVFGNDERAIGVDEVEQDCSAIRPTSGHLIFFDARRRPHYVRPLAHPDAVRIAAVMNFYLGSYPESTRPALLNEHLFGDRRPDRHPK
jgi:2OG-Fe(II) oxygenase superfamily